MISTNSNLLKQLSEIRANAENDKEYTIILTDNECIGPQTLSFKGKNNIIIRLKSESEKIISLQNNGSLFTIETGVTLILDAGITLQGYSENTSSLVEVNEAGTLIMNEGSKIKGNTFNSTNFLDNGSGGVYVKGNFIMNGGDITGNASADIGASQGGGVCVQFKNAKFTMNGGKISYNEAAGIYGGGGVVVVGGNFIMNGGEIFKNRAASGCYGGGGVCVYGDFVMNGGEISSNEANCGGGVFVFLIEENDNFSKSAGIIYGNSGNGNSNISTAGDYRGHAVCVAKFIGEGLKVCKYQDNDVHSKLNSNTLEGLNDGLTTSKKSDGCYIATAVYGSYDAPEVMILRQFRDKMLYPSIFGRAFISLYYHFSPSIAEKLKYATHINIFVRKVLDKFVGMLKKFHKNE